MIKQEMQLKRGQKAYIEELLFRRAEIEEEMEDLKQQILHGTPHVDAVPGQGYISDPTAKKAIELSSNRWLVRTQHELEAVDRALTEVSGRHKQLYRLKYLQGERSWYKISCELGYSERSCYRIRNELLWHIARKLCMIK